MVQSKKFNLIVAACENSGIGYKGDLPWHLKNELKHFSKMTKKVSAKTKINAVIMGRKTYFGIPENKRPLSDRLNIVLSRNPVNKDYPAQVIVCKSFEDALKELETPSNKIKIENIWIVGGSTVYNEAMKSPLCHRLYFTEIQKKFECDTFFPKIPENFHLIEDYEDIPKEIQQENGICYQYKIYEKLD